ncbi:alpha/beta hydrolase [Comamonas phosphati]|nr:alpha/beta hydrolase [Comamonas phosphati]
MTCAPMPWASAVERVCIPWRDRQVEIEYQWLEAHRADAPVMIFLHEGLGSVAMWKDFPAQLCRAAGLRGLVYSRPGYGRSTPRLPGEVWESDFMHRQAHEVLPVLREALGLAQPAWLLGHSDGGSIALLHAARFPELTAGVVLMAPHVMVEDISVASIAKAAEAYHQGGQGGLRERLARYHADVDSAFGGWAGIWLDPAFRRWNIEAEAACLRSPTLAIQGLDDEYGTLEQVRAIARVALSVKLLELPACGHSPHRDQPEQVTESIRQFIQTSRRQA